MYKYHPGISVPLKIVDEGKVKCDRVYKMQSSIICSIQAGLLHLGTYVMYFLQCVKPWVAFMINIHGTLTRYVKLRVAHAPGMQETFFPPPTSEKKRKLAIPLCTKANESRTCRDAYWDH